MITTTWWIIDPKGNRIGYTEDFSFAIELEKNGFNVIKVTTEHAPTIH